MTKLSERSQSILKLVSCFGIKIHESVITLLREAYPNIHDSLEHVIKEGYMIKVGTFEYKFVHDKVREAAHSLMPQVLLTAISDQADKSNEGGSRAKAENKVCRVGAHHIFFNPLHIAFMLLIFVVLPPLMKHQYQEKPGQILFSACRGKTLGEATLPIVDLINRGLHSIEKNVEIAQLNLEAGKKCFEQSDYATADTYLKKGLSLLPDNPWHSQYPLTLELYCLSSMSAYACGNSENAQDAVQVVLKEAHCIDDKCDAYFLLVNIYQAREGTR